MAVAVEDRENYTSLQEFTEDTSTRGSRFTLGFNPVLNRPVPGTPLGSAALALKLNSLHGRYIQLCGDYTNLGQSCSKKVKKCRECPEDWLHIGDKCYHFSDDKLDWLKSRDSCTEMGSHLTILHAMEQHDAIEKEARRIGGFDYHFWIGLSDIEKEGDWRWVDNTTLKNKYWDEWSSEPNNHLSGGAHGEDCAVLNSHSKTWFDVPCDNIYKRVCQMDAIRLN
ncbi:CD209 antigen-like protein E isoform X2 [Lampris incognitus]|uniref:CD209 antigen-like protein E isoform X2 n=1 Tax=Lampris incognitus TaxID=2546036 RepID=UPI0024B4EE99|nr:CD209 antigen-like protein E isoform X2 [Lampris incognitus]